MKRVLVIIALMLSSASAYGSGWTKSIAVAQAEAKKQNRIIFVDLFAAWCGWCHRMEREVFPTEKFQQATKNMVLLRVDIEDRGEGMRLAQEYEIRQLPTFLMIDPEGLLVGVIRGYAQSEPFSKRIIEQETVYRNFKREASREKTFGNDPSRRLKLAIDYISRRGYKAGDSRFRALISDKKTPADVRDSAYYHLAYSLREQQRYDEAVKTLNTFFALQGKGESLERARLLLGQMLAERGNYKAALAELKNFKKTFPASPFMATVDTLLPQIERAAARAN